MSNEDNGGVSAYTPEEIIRGIVSGMTPEQTAVIAKASQAAAYAVQDIYAQGYAMAQPDNAEDWIQVYTDHVWAYAGVYAVANTIAQLEWRMKRQERGKEPEEVEDHQVLRVLNKPNDSVTGYDLMESLVVYLECSGVGYWEIVYGQDELVVSGQPVRYDNPYPIELWNVRPDWLSPVPAKDGKGVDHYEFQTRKHARKRQFATDKIVPVRYFHPLSELLGLGSLQPAVNDLRLDKQMSSWNLDFFQHGTVAEGIFTTPQETVTRKEMENLGVQLQSFVEGKGRTNLILTKGLDYKPIGTPPKDIDYRLGRSDNREAILAAIGVPPVKVGLLEHAKYDNYALQLEAFYRDTIIPKAKRIEGAVNLFFLSRFPDVAADRAKGIDVWVEFDKADITKEDTDKLSKRLSEEIRTGRRTPNEAREAMGLDPYDEKTQPGGDVFYMDKGLVPVTGEAPEPAEPLEGPQPPEGEEDELTMELAEDELQKRVTRLESVLVRLGDLEERLERAETRARHADQD